MMGKPGSQRWVADARLGSRNGPSPPSGHTHGWRSFPLLPQTPLLALLLGAGRAGVGAQFCGWERGWISNYASRRSLL